MSIRSTILAAAAAVLNEGRPEGVPEVVLDLGFEPPIPSGALYVATDTCERIGGPRGPLVRRRLMLTLEWRVKGDTQVEMLDALDPLTAWATACLGGSRLGGTVHEVEEKQTTVEMEQRDYPYLLAVTEFEVSYQHRVDDATQWA